MSIRRKLSKRREAFSSDDSGFFRPPPPPPPLQPAQTREDSPYPVETDNDGPSDGAFNDVIALEPGMCMYTRVPRVPAEEVDGGGSTIVDILTEMFEETGYDLSTAPAEMIAGELQVAFLILVLELNEPGGSYAADVEQESVFKPTEDFSRECLLFKITNIGLDTIYI